MSDESLSRTSRWERRLPRRRARRSRRSNPGSGRRIPEPFSPLRRLVALALLVLASGLPVEAQESAPASSAAARPTPPKPSASAPPPPVDAERWIEAVPVLLWWGGADQPRLQVCTSDLPGVSETACPIPGAPSEVRSIQVECRFDCSPLPLRQRVRLWGRLDGSRFVAEKSEAIATSPP